MSEENKIELEEADIDTKVTEEYSAKRKNNKNCGY